MNEASGPIITTIIPTYRRPQLLRRAVCSVLNQTYSHLQVCIYDNASGDETASVVADLAESDARVRYYCHSEDMGAFNNFTFGMERVNTQFFSILSDDDLLLPDFYETAMQGFARMPDAMFSAGTTLVTDNDSALDSYPPVIEKGKILSVFPPFVKGSGQYQPPKGLFRIIQNHLIWTAVLFRREVLDEVGTLDEKTGAMSEQDYLFRIAARFPIVISQVPCAVFVDHELAYSHSRYLEVVWPGWLRIMANILGDDRISAADRVRAERAFTKKLEEWLIGLGIRAVIHKKFDEASKIVGVLRDVYQLRTKALALYLIAKLCQHVPVGVTQLVPPSLVYLKKVRIFIISLGPGNHT